MSKTDYVTPFITGLGIGVAATMLLAPESGAKTRKRIRQAANTASHAVKDRVDDLGHAMKVTRKAANRAVDKSKDAAHTAGKVLEDGFRRLQKVV